MNKIKLGLIYGGVSTEHEVSISSYESIIKNIDKDKYEITSFYISKDGTWFTDGKRTKDVFNSLKEMDCVFPILHGKNGEDGNIAGMLEIIGTAYVGCKTLSSAICMDKVITKKLLEKANISVAKYMFIKKINDNFYWVQDNYDYVLLDKEILDLSVNTLLNYPVVVKPSRSGSSVGVSVANDYLELENAINEASIYDDKILIEEFIDAYSSPKVMNFDEKAAQIIFGKAIPAIMLYCSKDSDKWEEYKKLMTTISEKINGKLKVVQTDIKEGMASRLAEYIGVKESDLPSVRIADTRVDLKKYNMEGEINEKNILQFIEDWENNKLKPHLKSAEEPKENNGDVLVVVGKTYEREVINNRKDVMLLFYAPWCGHCKALHPKYEEVAKKLKEKNPKLVMAKIDATENEVENINISGFPTIKFYAGDRKGKMPIDYDGDRTVEDIIKFIKKNAANPIVYDEDKTETKDEKPKQDKTEEL